MVFAFAFIFCFPSIDDLKADYDANSVRCNCLIDKIQTNDTLQIFYKSLGCEYISNELIRIYFRNNDLVADFTVIGYENDRISVFLTDSSIIAYSQFEIEGNIYRASRICTTTDYFVVGLKSDTIRFEDDGCEFKDYNNMKVNIFGKDAIDSLLEKTYH